MLCPEAGEDAPRIRTLWKHAREAVRFYHGAVHGELKGLFGLAPAPAHGAEDIRRLQGRLDSPAQVLVTNILVEPVRNIIQVLDGTSGPEG